MSWHQNKTHWRQFGNEAFIHIQDSLSNPRSGMNATTTPPDPTLTDVRV